MLPYNTQLNKQFTTLGVEFKESENAALRQQVKDMGEVIKEFRGSTELNILFPPSPENPEK